MALTHIYTRACKDTAGVSFTGTDIVTDDTELNFDGTIATSGTNIEIDWTCTAANLQSIALFSDQAAVIKTNSSGAPQETITLVANSPTIWTRAVDGAGKIPFSGNVTKMYVTNPSGSVAAMFKIRAIAHQHT
jgi:hypothetical protein